MIDSTFVTEALGTIDQTHDGLFQFDDLQPICSGHQTFHDDCSVFGNLSTYPGQDSQSKLQEPFRTSDTDFDNVYFDLLEKDQTLATDSTGLYGVGLAGHTVNGSISAMTNGPVISDLVSEPPMLLMNVSNGNLEISESGSCGDSDSDSSYSPNTRTNTLFS